MHILGRGKKVRAFLVWQKWQYTGMRHNCAEPLGRVSQRIRRKALKFSYKNLIINLVSYFWNLFLAPTYKAWETSVQIVMRSQKVNSKRNEIRWSVFRIPLCPQELLRVAQALANHLKRFEHAFHSSRYLTFKCLTFHFQKLDNTIKRQWFWEDHLYKITY